MTNRKGKENFANVWQADSYRTRRYTTNDVDTGLKRNILKFSQPLWISDVSCANKFWEVNQAIDGYKKRKC